MESNKFDLNKSDLIKIVDGAVIAVLGALITYALTVVGNFNFGVYTPLIVAFAGVFANSARKYLAGQS